jgi:triosephosphate isomerase
MKQQNKIIIGNWKMNPSSFKEAEKIFKNINKNNKFFNKNKVIICPPFVFLDRLNKISKKIILGAQNIYPSNSGLPTGEVSIEMLESLKVKYVILGHSERRGLGEDNIFINKKVKTVISSSATPVLCIGEKERDEEHQYLGFVKTQIEECLDGISKDSLKEIIIAYEPVWAIGKNAKREATPEEFEEMSIFIKKVLSDKFGVKNVEGVKIIYGGSVNPKNALDFIKVGAEGLLVGRDSLLPEKFTEILKIINEDSKTN